MASIMMMNLNANSGRNKIQPLVDILRKYNVGVAVITETHLEPGEEWSIPGYSIIRWDRKIYISPSGGVAILVRATIKFRMISDIVTRVIETTGVTLTEYGNLKIFAVYCPGPTQPVTTGTTLFHDDLDNLMSKGGKCIIGGDLNAHHADWGHCRPNKNGEELFNIAREKDFTVYLPDKPTFVRKNVKNPSKLDIFVANFEIDNPLAINDRISDHRPVICKLKINWILYQTVGQNTSVQDQNTAINDFNNEIELNPSNEVQASPEDQETNHEGHSNRETADRIAEKSDEEEVFTPKKLMVDTISSVCCTFVVTILKKAAYKVLYGILLQCMSCVASGFIGKYQADTSVDAIITLRQILEKCREFNVPTHHLFMNLRALYDKVDRDQLWQIMDEIGLPTKLTRLIKITMDNLMPGNGLRQGCELSVLLFNIAIEGIVRRAIIEREGTIFEKPVQLISYNGNMDLIALTYPELETAYAAFKTEANRVGVVVSSENVKYMRARGSKEDNETDDSPILLSNDTFKPVDKYLFLDSMVTADNDTSTEIERRIKAGDLAYKEHLRTRESTPRKNNKKLDIYKTEILPKVLVGHESWTMLETDKARLKKFESEVLKSIGGNEIIVGTAQFDRLRWMEKVTRKPRDSPVRMVLETNPKGKRKQGRPQKRWFDCIKEDLEEIDVSEDVWKLDSQRWQQILRTAAEEFLD